MPGTVAGIQSSVVKWADEISSPVAYTSDARCNCQVKVVEG